MRSIVAGLAVLSVVACVGLMLFGSGSTFPKLEPGPGPEIRGVTLDARSRPSDAELLRLAELGVTHLFVVPFGWQRSPNEPSVMLRTQNDRWYSEDDDGIRDLDHRSDSLGMTVVIKPHLWIRGSLPSDVGFFSDGDRELWERDYRTFAMHYARLSADIDAPLFVVGTELAGVALERPRFWRTLIADVRAVYSGELTYAANWWEEYEHVTFWDALDYVGVQAYFPLVEVDSGAAAPNIVELHEGWDAHVSALERTADRIGLPVLFTEIGYRSVGYAAAEPWRWPERAEQVDSRPDLQAGLYGAFFNRLWHRDWFAGAVIWKWRPGAVSETRRSRDAVDFTVRDKPAEQVIADWYSR